MNKKGKFISIEKQIVRRIVGIILILSVVLGMVGSILTYYSSITVLKEAMIETAKVTGTRMATEMEKFISVICSMGTTPQLSEARFTITEKKEMLAQIISVYQLEQANILNKDGITLDGQDYSNNNYFEICMQGQAYVIVDPTFLDLDGTTNFSIIMAAPLWKNGEKGTEIVGVVTITLQDDFLSEIISEIQVAKSGGAYMINESGILIADTSRERIGVINIQEQAKTDSSAKKQAAIEKQMIEGLEGYGTLTSYEGVTQIVAYAPVPNINGWSVGIYVNQNDFMGSVYESLFISCFIIVAFIIIGYIIAIKFGKNIAQPIKLCAVRLETLAEGDLNTPIPKINREDEVGVLAKATERIVKDLTEMIKDETYLLEEMAKGNFKIESSAEYKGSFAPLKITILQILNSLNNILKKIDLVAGQVSKGAEQVSYSATLLAQGSTEQANTIEELSTTLQQISYKISETATNTIQARQETTTVSLEIQRNNKQLEDMTEAMNHISTSSERIQNIIQTIQDIASRTTMLSLNASIEAARSAESGKGFAVVADEIRELANQSTEAAKKTTILIKESMFAVDNGIQIANKAAQSMHVVVQSIGNVVNKIENIETASNHQANAIEQITEKVNQIADVVQCNSATSEESSTASQQLFEHAKGMKEMVEQFQVK